MSKSWKTVIVFFVTAFVCWYAGIVINPSNFELILWIAAVIASILCVCFFIIAVIKQIKPNASPYKIFALTDFLIGIGVSAYAIYDILTDTGWFAGLFGAILLIYVIPIILLLLIIDFILYIINKKKAEKQ